jgi:hypothetical protein
MDTAWATGPPYILLLSENITWAQSLPSEDDISVQSEAARQRLERFMRESIGPRLAWKYKEIFFDNKDKAQLASLATEASRELQETYNTQDTFRKWIEDYEGDDWDMLYGITGLWRKVCFDAQQTLLFKTQVDYFVLLTSRQPDRERILEEIIYRCETHSDKWGPAGDLLKAEALRLAGKSEAAIETVNSIENSKHLSDAVRFRTELLKSRLLGTDSVDMLNRLSGRTGQSLCADDFELNLKVAFLELRRGRAQLLAKVIARWPESADFVGGVILSGMEYQRTRGQLTEELLRKSVFEITLAVKAAGKRQTEQYQGLVAVICQQERFQTPLVLYVTAQALAESRPAETVGYYLRAAQARQKAENNELKIDAVEIAKQGAQVAHKVYYDKPQYRPVAAEMIDYYCAIAGDRVDETIEYLYTRLLSGEGKTSKAIELLQKIAQKTGKFSKQAELDLIVHGLQDGSDDSELRHEPTKKLKNLIDTIDGTGEQDKSVKAEAVRLYCQLILEDDDKASAEKVLALLEGTEGVDIQKSCILRAVALKKSGKLWAAVNELLKAAKFDNCEYGTEGLDILKTILDNRIDEHKHYMADFMLYIDACDQLAEYCLACAGPQWQTQAGLIRAEIAILCPRMSLVDYHNEGLDKAEQILTKLSVQDCDNNIDWLRCKARLLMAKKRFADASRVWGQVRAANKTASGKQSRQWWRAKYYEIQCWGQLGDTTGADIVHAVEVLEGSFSDIPEFWAMKLAELKAGAGR